MASITVTPNEGNFGDTITIAGTAFALSTAITISYGSLTPTTTPTTVTTDGAGAFSCTITPPNHAYGTIVITASDGSSSATGSFELLRLPEYCQVKDIADWLRVNINSNTDPNREMVNNYIMMNEDHIDRETAHTWLTDKIYTTDTFNVSDVYDYGHGMYIPLKHRAVKEWDSTKGDKFEIWNGIEWVEQVVNNIFVNFEPTKGVLYIRGYIYTILTKNRFRITYRYGGSKEGETVPRDIKKACMLLTCMDILSTDFKMSQIAYGGEGNIDKKGVMDKWQKDVDKIIWNHNEIITIW